MLRKILMVCMIVSAAIATPAVAKYDPGSVPGMMKKLHGFKGKHISGGLHCNPGGGSKNCDFYTKRASKAYARYLKFKKIYTDCQHNTEGHGSNCKIQKYGFKHTQDKHKSKNSKCNLCNKCNMYKRKAAVAYKKYLFYEKKRKRACPTEAAPVAYDQNITTPEDTNISIMLTGTDSNAKPLSYVMLTQPAQGVLYGTEPNFIYAPHADYTGEDSFTFKVNNGTIDSNIATVSIIVTPVNDAPIVEDKHFVVPEDTNVSMLLTGFDKDGDTLTYHIKKEPVHGTVTGNASNFTYKPVKGYYGSDHFVYIANDGTIDSNEATGTIEIIRNNTSAPIAIDQNVTTDENSAVDIELLGLDSDGDTLTYSVVTQPRNGILSGTGKDITYTPDGNYSGTDSFTFKVNDGLSASNVATVHILVKEKAEVSCKDIPVVTGALNPVVKWHWDGSQTSENPLSVETISSPIVGQLNDDNGDGKIDNNDNPDIVFTTFYNWEVFRGKGILRAVNGKSGEELWSIPKNQYLISPNAYSALGDIDHDGLNEIITITNDGHLIAFENDGTFKWESNYRINGDSWAISLNDLDSDGNIELIVGSIIFNADGSLKRDINSPYTASNVFGGLFSTVVDLNNDGKKEILNGSAAYDLNGTVLWDAHLGNGFTAIGNFNHDIYPEIVFVGGQSVTLLDHNGHIIWGPVGLAGANRGMGGAPTIADLDGDGLPEIGVAAYTYYIALDTDGTVMWKQRTFDDSEITGSTVFDFEGDGRAEILYFDEQKFRIFDGATGTVRFEMSNTSVTSREYPIVADIDKDGHAEIILPANKIYHGGADYGMKVLEDANDSWMPTRSIWNEYNYHITNINDDGTIPKYEEPSWLTHNTYRLNTFAVNTRCQKPPVAYEGNYTTLEDTAKSIALYAKDINRDTLTYTVTKQPVHGTLEGTAPYLIYIPDNGYVGSDHFSYRVNDGYVDSNEANITITVLSSDNALIAVDDEVTLNEDTNITVNVLENDSNATGVASMAIVVSPMHGAARIVNDQVHYAPKANYHGEDVFYYTYRNSNGFVSNAAKVTLNIGASNDAPVAEDQNLSIDEDTEVVTTLRASDADGDTLVYSIVTPPAHGKLNGVAPYYAYVPDKDYVGTDSFSFKAFDGNLDSNVAIVSITINPVNDAPVAIVGPNQRKLLGKPVFLDGNSSYDVDGEIVSYVWREGNMTLSDQSTFTKNDFTLGEHTLMLTVTDNDGLSASSTTIVNILSVDTPDTTPPVITVLGERPAQLNIGDTYVDAGATAYDSRDGSVSVSTQNNVNTSVAGTYTVHYSAVDSAGNSATATRMVMVIDRSAPDVTPPVITVLGDNPQTVYQNRPYVDAGVRVIDDHDGNIGYALSHNINTAQIGKYQVHYTATDSAGNSATATREVLVRDPNGNRPPLANAGSDITVSLGESVTLDGSASRDLDGEIVLYLWQEVEQNLSTSPHFTKNDWSAGLHTLTLTVVDNEGATGSDSVIVRVIDPNDTTPPSVAIGTPAENTKVTLQTEIVGTASDENLDYYTLSLSPVGKDTYTEFARGTVSVRDGVLGVLDATTLANGIYDLKLAAVDENGATATASTKVIIDGRAKIGNFSFTVRDFDLKVGGIPVQVNRTYSTLQRFKKYDFTYGWSIDYQNVKLEESIHPGKAWRTTPDTLVGYCFKEAKQHIVNIALPDGTTERFAYKFARECGHYSIGSFYDAPVLIPLDGTEAKLEAVDGSDTVAMNDAGEIIDGNSLAPYDPGLYRLTLPNGMVYEIDQNKGITKVVNLRGDTLQYNHNGIISSRGESLAFERDSEDRITKITDLAGRSVTYHYNPNGDLDYVIDQMGYKTQYRYLPGHLLSEYYDPSGTRLAKNIYDEAGRLIEIIDADGNAVAFTHNIEGKEEIVKDRLGRTSVLVYDEAGNVLSQTNPLGETTVRTYDAKGRELTVTDPLGNTLTNTYDANGNLLSTTDALGNTETTTYNDKQSPTSITDKNGNTLNIVYNDYNNPRYIITPSGATTTYYYDQFGNKVQSINEYNQTTVYTYKNRFVSTLGDVSSTGKVESETRPDGTKITYTYDESLNLLTTTTTTAEGITTTTANTYDAFNRITSTTDERGNTTTYEYDARGNKVSMTDIYGLKTTYEYNTQNKLTKTTYPDGTTELKTYDAMGNLLSETDKEGHTTTYEYDGADRLIKTTYPDGTATSKTYDAAGRVTSTTDQRGNTTTYEYDAAGSKIAQTDALGNKTTFTYDAQGNLLSVTDALGQTTRYEYNTLNQRVKTIYPDGSITTQSMNISGLPESKTDEAGHTTQYGYDTNKTIPLLERVTLADGAVTRYSYDSQGRKTSLTDALSHTTAWSYQPTGELSSETLPQGERKTFTYDAQGRQTQITDYANKAQKFIYDSYDRLVRIEYSDGNTVTYDYTPSGRVKTITNTQGTIANTYDAMGRLKTQTNPSGETITYTYDEAGNITRIETPTQSISKTYDALNRLKTVTDDQGTTTYEYDAIGRVTQVTYPNGITTAYTYDSRNRVTKIEHKKSDGTVLQSFAYTYDAVGNRTQVVENTGRTVTYEYNDVNQLTKETVTNDPNGNNTTTTYTYDAVGNLVSKTIDGIETSYTYNANDQLTQKGSITYTYDANGNLIDDGTNSYEYDDKNRLVKVTTPNDIVEYSYDANDNRIAKTTSKGTTTYLIDANTPFAQVITESLENGTKIRYTYGNDLLSDGEHSFLTDALGSTRALADSAGQITDTYSYTPYGKLVSHDGNATNSFLYTGEQLDGETSNYYLRARYYSPDMTRFLSRDTYDGTLNDPLSQNHYLYASGNPIMFVDPSGHCFTMSGMMQATVITGILATSYYATIGNNSRGGYGGSAWDIVIDSYFYNFSLSYMYYELINGEEGIEINDRTEAQQKEAQKEHDSYKQKCSNGPKRSQFQNGCDYHKALLKWSTECKNAVEEFDKKWTDKKRPNGHKNSWIKDMENNIKKAKKFISKKGC